MEMEIGDLYVMQISFAQILRWIPRYLVFDINERLSYKIPWIAYLYLVYYADFSRKSCWMIHRKTF